MVTGCASEIEPHRFAAMGGVARVVSNADKTGAETWRTLVKGEARPIVVRQPDGLGRATPGQDDRRLARTRATVAVQNGCDHRCTFCIIPAGRGRSRSLPMDDVIASVRRHADAGCPEVVLTGVDLTAYGADLPDRPSLGRLVRAILDEVPRLARLRLSSIDVGEVDTELARVIGDEPRLMPHLHLSLQSGDDLILKRMKRRHGRRDAIDFCTDVRRRRGDVAFGADFIVGFPTETEAMFASTLALIDDCGLTYLHVFPYSPRRGTPAERMPQVAASVIGERATRLRAAGARALAGHLDRMCGRTIEVLLENGGIGRTPEFAEVEIASPAHEPGTMLLAKVTGHDGRRLQGEVLA